MPNVIYHGATTEAFRKCGVVSGNGKFAVILIRLPNLPKRGFLGRNGKEESTDEEGQREQTTSYASHHKRTEHQSESWGNANDRRNGLYQ
jgi:hypothetical protein